MRRGQREATRGATIVGPLDGVRVVELASFLAGPSATALMADMGADVVKIERPRGDDLRGNQQHLQAKPHINYVYEVDNRGKRSIVIDPTRRGGVDALHRIVAQADVFVTNLTPGASRSGLRLNESPASIVTTGSPVPYASTAALVMLLV